MRVVLGVSGASGAALAMDCAAALRRAGAAVDLVLSAMAERTLAEEIGPDAADRLRAMAARVHPLADLGASIASGVQLKERRPLVLLAREAPLTLAHLRNMQAAAEMGAVILPPVPAFYLRPASLAEVTAQIAARAVDLLHLDPPLARAWTPDPIGENS